MTLTLGNKINSLKAQSELSKSTALLSKTFERLASGLRINRASDDAASLAVASGLISDTRVFGHAIRNVNDGLSLLGIAEGALKELSQISERQKELATQAANGTFTTTQRLAMNKEANALVEEFNRIVDTTVFNGIKPLDGSTRSVTIQAGFGTQAAIVLDFGTGLARTVGDGTFTLANTLSTGGNPRSVTAMDVNGDGNLDFITGDQGVDSVSVFLGNGNGTFKARSAYTVGDGPYEVKAVDTNGDGALDLITANANAGTVSVLINNGDGTYKAQTAYTVGSNPRTVEYADLNADGANDLLIADGTAGTVSLLMGNGDGTFKARATVLIAPTLSWPLDARFGDFNSDGKLDIASTIDGNNTLGIAFGNGNGTFKTPVHYTTSNNPIDLRVADFNNDGYDDVVSTAYLGNAVDIFINNGDGTFKSRQSLSASTLAYGVATEDFNGDGVSDLVVALQGADKFSVFLNNGDGTFAAAVSYTTGGAPWGIATADFNNDGVADIVTANNVGTNASVYLGDTTTSTSVGALDLRSVAAAQRALETLSATHDRITTELGKIGASQSRLAAAASVLEVVRENYQAASDRILGVDVAEETAKLIRLQILQTATTAILAQANQESSVVLKLLA